MVLNAVVSATKPVTLDYVAAAVGFHRSIVYRLIRSLEAAGYVARDAAVSGYSIGPTLLSMSVSVAKRFNVGAMLRPAMDAIVAGFGETVSLHVHSGNMRVCVEVAEGTHSIRRMIPIGESFPVYLGETGRALLSMLADGEINALLEDAQHKGVDPEPIRAAVGEVRRDGFYVGIGVRTPEIGSISVPLQGIGGANYAVTVSGPSGRWGRAAMMEAAPKIAALLADARSKAIRG